MNRFDRLIKTLFGQETVEKAEQIDLSRYGPDDHEAVRDAMRELFVRFKGQPAKQMQVVNALGERRALLLCKLLCEAED